MKLLRELNLYEARQSGGPPQKNLDKVIRGINSLISNEELTMTEFMDGNEVSDLKLNDEGGIHLYDEDGTELWGPSEGLADLSNHTFYAEISFKEVIKLAMKI